MKRYKNQSGITIISLVVTLVVMLIVAGVALNLGVGDKGLIGSTQNTIDQYENVSEQEQIAVNQMVEDFNQVLNEQTVEQGEGSIKENPSIELQAWTSTGRNVSITTNASYKVQYSTDYKRTWQDYTGGSIVMPNDSTIYARYVDKSDSRKTSNIVSRKIKDTEPPVLTAKVTDIQASKISVTASATDNEMGMPNEISYQFYLKDESTNSYEYYKTTTDGNYTFEGLKDSTYYDILISAKDAAGNTGTYKLSSESGEIPDLNPDVNIWFTLEPEELTNQNVKLTITTVGINDKFTVQYSFDGSKYENYTDGITVKDNGRVYARLTDGQNVGKQTYIDVNNIDRVPPTGSVSITNKKTYSLTAKVGTIRDDRQVADNQVYKYYVKETAQDDYPTDPVYEGPNTSYEITGLQASTSYDVKVTFKDKAGNEGYAEATGQTVEIPALTDQNSTFTPSETRVTNKDITMTITTTVRNYTLQYSLNGKDYINYTGAITIGENTTVYARLTDGIGYGGARAYAIRNIDKSLSDLEVLIKRDEILENQETVTDKNKNEITIPKGYKPTEDASTIDKGVVVEDSKGNQFVWIPVGSVYKEDGSEITINYDRYVYGSWVDGGVDELTGSTLIKENQDSETYYTEILDDGELSSVTNYKGYYIGRYEVGTDRERTSGTGTGDTPMVQANKNVYNYVTKDEALYLSEQLVKENDTLTAKLPSGAAWDTALKFMELTGNGDYLTNSTQGNYYNTKYGDKTSANKSQLIKTGQTQAVNNLYDMGGNIAEWSSETHSNVNESSTIRGGYYEKQSNEQPVIHRASAQNFENGTIGFRPVIFLDLGGVMPQVQASYSISSDKYTATISVQIINSSEIDKKDSIKLYNSKNVEIGSKTGTSRASFTVTEDGAYTVVVTTTTDGIQSIARKRVLISGLKIHTDYGKIEVVWLDNENNLIDEPQAPVLNGMTPIKWNGVTETNTTEEDPDWYDYIAKDGNADNVSSRWANAKDGNGSYFVWIPRYAYRITYYASQDSETPTGYYDARGMVDINGSVKYALDEGIETVEKDGKSYIVHPAFMDDTESTFSHGGWDSDLSGLWIAKYETSGSSSSFKIVPNTSSTFFNIGDSYTYAKAYNTSLESHLMKNSEWGAVAYLTHSQYGRNGNEIDINNSSSYITGNGGGSTNASQASGVTNAYDTEEGQKASSTGNIYGIYDLSGGKYEYVAAFDKESSSSYLTNTSHGGKMTAEAKDEEGNYISTKYITAYTNGTSTYGGVKVYEVGKIGDATKEVNVGAGPYNWFSEYGYFLCSSSPFFSRGGRYRGGSSAGVFYSDYQIGYSYDNYGFRVALPGAIL